MAESDSTLYIDVELDLDKLDQQLDKAKQVVQSKEIGDIVIKPKIDTASIEKELASAAREASNLGNALDQGMGTAEQAVSGVAKQLTLSKESTVALASAITTGFVPGIREADSLIGKMLENLNEATKARAIELGGNLVDRKAELQFITKELKTATGDYKIELNLDKTNVQTEISNINKELRQIAQTSKQAEDTMTKSMDDIKIHATETGIALDKMAKQRLLTLSTNALEKQAEIQRLNTEIKTAEGEHKIVLTLEKDQATRELQQITQKITNIKATGNEATKAMSSGFSGLSKSIQTGLFSTFGAFSIAGAISTGIHAVSREMNAAIDTAISFESAFAGVEKTLDATEQQFTALQGTLLNLSTTSLPMTFEEIAKVAELGGQMGVGIEDLTKFTDTVVRMGVSTNLASEQASLSFARISNILQLPLSEVDKLGSAIVDLGNNFAAQEDEITEFLTRISGAGVLADMTAGDLAGISTALTAVGVKAEAGGSAVSKALLTMNSAVAEGGKKLEGFAKTAGKTPQEFAKLWKEDAGEAFIQFVEGLKNAGDKADGIISNLLGNNVRTKQSFLSIANASGLLREAIEMGNQAYEENTALLVESNKRFATAESQLQLTTNKFQAMRAEIGEQLLPIMMGMKEVFLNLYQGITSVVLGFTSLSAAAKVLLGAGGITALGVALFALNPVLAAVAGGLALVTGAMYLIGKAGQESASEIEVLQDRLGELGKVADGIRNEIIELTDAFATGKISLSEYTEQYDALTVKLEETEAEIEKVAVQMARLQEVQDGQKELSAKQTKAAEDYKQAISDTRKEQDNYMKTLEDVKKASEDASLSDEQRAFALESYKAMLNTLPEYEQKWAQANREAKESLQVSTLAIDEQSDAMLLLSNMARSAEEQTFLLSKVKMGTADNVAELNAWAQANTFLTNTTMRALKAQLLMAKLTKVSVTMEMQSAQKATESRGLSLEKLGATYTLAKGAKDIEALSASISQLEGQITELDNLQGGVFGAQTTREGYQSAKATLQEQRDMNLSLIQDQEVLSGSLTSVKNAMTKVNKESEIYNGLAAEQLAIEKRIAELSKAGENAPSGKKGKEKSETEILKEKEALLRHIAEMEILSVQQSEMTEVQKAKTIIKINEQLLKDIKALKGKEVETFVEAAEEIVKKYEAIKKEGETAFKETAKDIEGVAKEIKKLGDDIDKTKEKIQDIEEKKIEDLKDRYADVDDKLKDVNEKLEENRKEIAGTDLSSMKDEWEEVTKSVDKSTESMEKTRDKISDILAKMKELEASTSKSLADRYQEINKELDANAKALQKYLGFAVLTDEDAAEKLKLEEERTKLLREQAIAQGKITQADIDAAKARSEETESEKILRETNEKKAAIEAELKMFQDQLAQQETEYQGYKEKQTEILRHYSRQELEENEDKLLKLLEQQKEYEDERVKLLEEQRQLENVLTRQQQQDALDWAAKTKTQQIIIEADLEKKAQEVELASFQKMLNQKLSLLQKYFGDVADIQRIYGDYGIEFDKETLDKLRESGSMIKGAGGGSSISQGVEKVTTFSKEQEEAQKKLDKIETLFDKLTTEDKKNITLMQSTLTEILRLKNIINASMGTGGVLTNDYSKTVTQTNNYSVSGNVSAESISRQIIAQLKF